jgi:2-iminobutanoate/2-iminopropanoate deaminase
MQYCHTDRAPKAIGPYSQAVKQGSMVYTSGQVPLDPATGELVQDTFESMVRRVFDNLKAVLESAGADFPDVVKATVYLTDLGDFQKLNEIYAEYFGAHRPARSTVGVAQLPKGARVEIDLIAQLS